MAKKNNVVPFQKAAISTEAQVAAVGKKVINGMEFVSIASEVGRYYEFLTEAGVARVGIENPAWLFVRPSGAHVVVDQEGLAHYIPKGFIHLVWRNKEGQDAVQF